MAIAGFLDKANRRVFYKGPGEVKACPYTLQPFFWSLTVALRHHVCDRC